jgi:molybdopterin/thiamine biosynthesis adenylyltransferase
MRNGRRKRKGQKRTRPSAASTTSTAPASSSGSSGSAKTTEGSASGTKLITWWESEPQRLEYELRLLEAAGIAYRIDEAAKRDGLLVINVEVNTADDQELALQARFPDLYPYFRFEIKAPQLSLPHHQHPFGGQLCVIGRATANWKTTDTLADFVGQRVPSVLSSGSAETSAEVSEIEEHQGEPFSDYYRYVKDSMILVGSGWSIDRSIASGTLILGIAEGVSDVIRGAVLRISDQRGAILAEADPALQRLYKKRIAARWVRSDKPIVETDAGKFLELLRADHQELRKPAWEYLGGGRIDVVGVLFPEEHSWRGKAADGWVFIVRVSKQVGRSRMGGAYLARAGRAGRTDMLGRIPELSGLQNQKIALCGNGALGGPSAIEFARAGVGELRLLDFDFVDPATAIRWPLGLSASGLNKVEVLQKFIEQNYPYTDVKTFGHRIGTIRENASEPADQTVLAQLMEGVDLVYDATAEIGVNHLLSDLAAAYNVTYICVSTTHGAWGGRLIRVRPGRSDGCWMCHQWALQEGIIPSPPSDPEGEVQPAGCADPTFTGTSFDIMQIVLAGVRLAIGTLQSGVAHGYPDVGWDVAVISLREETGACITPNWKVFPLERHESCQNERAHQGHRVVASKGF